MHVPEKNFKFHLTVKIDLDEIVYYLKQVFHLLYDKSVTPAETYKNQYKNENKLKK